MPTLKERIRDAVDHGIVLAFAERAIGEVNRAPRVLNLIGEQVAPILDDLEAEHGRELETYRRSDAELRGTVTRLAEDLEAARRAAALQGERVLELSDELREKQRDDAIAELGDRLLAQISTDGLGRLAAARAAAHELDAFLSGIDTADVVDQAEVFFHDELQRLTSAVYTAIEGNDSNRTRTAANGT